MQTEIATDPAEHPLRAYRRRNELSQDALASAADTTKATISRIESGTLDPTFALMRRLITATNGEVTADMLIAWAPHESRGGDAKTAGESPPPS